jgi:hypothetical protein
MSAMLVRDSRTVGRSLLLGGFVCLAIVVFTHVAEKLRLFPVMGWACQIVLVITSIWPARCLAQCF